MFDDSPDLATLSDDAFKAKSLLIARRRRYYEKNHAAILERKRRHYADKPDKKKEASRLYREIRPEKIREMSKAYLEANRELLYEKNRKWRKANPQLAKDLQRNYRAAHKKEASKASLQWRLEHPDRFRERISKWQKANGGKVAAYGKKSKLARLQRIPSWAGGVGISMIYQAASIAKITWPENHIHVDHEVPLRGKCVSGLHVRNNLRIISAKENLTKANKFEF